MKNRSVWIKMAAGVIAGGSCYWLKAYDETELFGFNVWLVMSFSTLIFTLFYYLLSGYSDRSAVKFISLGVVLAVSGRIFYDVLFWDNSSHNLAPIEIALSAAVAFFASYLGARISSSLLRKL